MTEKTEPAIDRSIYPMPMFINFVVSNLAAAGGVDLAGVADRLRAAGAEVAGPTDTLWFTTDVSLSDADGNTVTMTAPR